MDKFRSSAQNSAFCGKLWFLMMMMMMTMVHCYVCVCACANREEGVVSDIQEDTATELQYRFVVYQRVI